MKRCSRLNDADDLCAFSRTISSIGRALSLPLLEEVNLAQDEFYYCRSNPTPALESFFRTYPTIKTVKLCGHWAWGSILGLFVATPTRQLCPLLQDLWLAPAKPLNESVLLEVVKSRTTPEVDSPHLRGVVPLQRLFFGPNDERLSLSVLATLRTHVAVDFKYPH
ncbi:hypothetical protein BOTBODRAFT_37013 [Botryobasidium botryosum FD-172 SS1]|uniref:Uncharacterized protein n=1 Tax=Botryobasidium botryosum (strain FD-172 SS1) TaxID=930990 RepID=A0A067M111_BOTB1|nr:hypothetical protein BOTBODRAFT_37013 [Botryobasidium botryosum FD-172 SS1]